MTETRVGIVIVGCGAVTRLVRVPVYPRLSDLAQVVGVCDADLGRADEMAPQFGPSARVYTSLEDALGDPDVTAVDICTPHALHAEHVIRALQSGRHVLVEKPIAARFEDGKGMVEAAQANARVLAVNEQIRFGSGLREARAQVESGRIGSLVSVRAHRLFELPAPYVASGWRNDPRVSSAGILIDQGPHYVHLLRRLASGVAGEVTHASALADNAQAPVAAVHLRFASGVLGEVLLAWNVPTPPTAAAGYAFGTLGSLEIDRRDAGLVRYGPGGDEQILVGRDDYLAAVEACMRDFLRAALGQTPAAEMSGEEGLRDLAVVDAALRSVESGRLEPVPGA
ncbi:MAG: Gfo/Idh/MocA family protein [Chloroflexota bacterium]